MLVTKNSGQSRAAQDVRFSDGAHGISGCSQNDVGSQLENPIRPRWTDELCFDLLTCHQLSEPNKRGYMKRLHEHWLNIRPEYRHLTAQNLRDQAHALIRRGFKFPAQQVEAANQPPQPHGSGEPTAADNVIDKETETVFLDLMTKALRPEAARTAAVHHRQLLAYDKVKKISTIAQQYIHRNCDLWELNCAVYAAAETVTKRKNKNKLIVNLKKRIKQLSNKIKSWRRKASQMQSLLEYITKNRKFTKRVKGIARDFKDKHHTTKKDKIVESKEQALDKIRALTAARKKVEKSLKRIEQNLAFSQSPSKFLNAKRENKQNSLDVQEAERYWKNLYGRSTSIDNGNTVIEAFAKHCNEAISQTNELRPISEEDIRNAINGKPNHSAPGPDRINTFWWKKLAITHKHLARIFNEFLNGEVPIPSWLSEGRTILIYKKGDPTCPENYRPITCLNTVYKIFTSVLQERILETIEPIWTGIYEQRGSKRGVAGVRDNILVDSCVSRDAITYKRNLSMAWIDYRKAFDCASHDLILKLLKQMKVHYKIVDCLTELFKSWQTRIVLGTGAKQQKSGAISYRRGVYQGDSLSPLLFCITLLPLSLTLRKQRGYLAGRPNNRIHKITHLLYMDDLKLYAQNEADLEEMIKLVYNYSTSIGMELGTKKCAVYHLKRGKGEEEGNNLDLVDGITIRHLQPGDSYTYLGVKQQRMNNIAEVKNDLKSRYKTVLQKIWSSELTARNKCRATNMLAVPILSHTFGAIKWNVDEIHQLDRDTRKVMTQNRSLHPNASVHRLYLSRNNGGRGLVNIEHLYNRIVISVAVEVLKSEDPLITLVKNHESYGNAAFLFRTAERAADQLNILLHLKTTTRSADDVAQLAPGQLRMKLKREVGALMEAHHLDKPMHSLFYKNIQELQLSRRHTFAFLRSSNLYSETEGFVMACQDGVFNTLQYRREVLGLQIIDTRCRACKGSPETLMHLLTACPKYAPNLYITRHDNALKVVLFHLRYVYGLDERQRLPHESIQPPSVDSNNKCKIFWNFPFHTTTRIAANKPDMVVQDREERRLYVVEMSCPGEKLIKEKEQEKLSKYRDLTYQLKLTYPEYEIVLIPLIIGVLGGVHSSAERNLKKIRKIKEHSIETLIMQMQKYVLLGSLHVLRAHENSSPTPCS